MTLLPLTIKESLKQTLSDLAAMTDVNGNLLWQYTAMFNSQVKRAIKGDGYSFNYPACFIEVKELSTEQWQLGTSAQDLEIIFHIYHREEDAMDGTLDQNFDVFDWRTYVRGYFIGYSNASNFGSFIFNKEKEDIEHGNVYHFMESFKTKYIDNSANPYLNGTYKKINTGNWNIDLTSNLEE